MKNKYYAIVNKIKRFFTRYSVSMIDESWTMVAPKLSFKYLPRVGEAVYLPEEKCYFQVLNVVYYMDKKQGIFLIVKKVQ